MNHRMLLVAVSLALVAGVGCKSSDSQKSGASDASASARGASTSGPSAQEMFIRGNKRLDSGNFEGAIESYESAVERDPKRWDAWLNLAIAHSKSDQFEEAIDAMEQCLANGGEGRAEVYFNLGNIYQRRGLYRQAIKSYRTARAHADKPDVDTLVNLGATLAVMNRPSDARAIYEEAQRLAPRDRRVQHGIAVTLNLQGDYEASIRAYEQLLSMHPDYTRAHYDKSHPLAELEAYERAIASLETYLQEAPEGRFAKQAKDRIEIYREKLESRTAQ